MSASSSVLLVLDDVWEQVRCVEDSCVRFAIVLACLFCDWRRGLAGLGPVGAVADTASTPCAWGKRECASFVTIDQPGWQICVSVPHLLLVISQGGSARSSVDWSPR